MATDPRRLRPAHLCRLLNSTPLGEVITERKLHAHRARAGLRIGDQAMDINPGPRQMADSTSIDQMIPAPGELFAAVDLLPLIYQELRKLAASLLQGESPGQTLQPTALVHEVYLRLVGTNHDRKWAGRGHFFGAAARAMRQILVDASRQKRAAKRGGGWNRLVLEDTDLIPGVPPRTEDLLSVDEAMTRLESKDPGKARIVELRYFAGLSVAEAAQILGISTAKAKRDWVFAKAWLYGELTRE
ncbi:sigma-70 family RNA polymerase sigma factor [Limnoglobus roseus]|uniref:RNA polymerase subunit sigma n=1 Tax=Limnoglobus roseus TaxID=2598579 RepID=A0A5C1ASY4_9BACT|nr:sigma-70 family RNA polymerase sigma factor [Limnoglobus roseus]QEL20692.1 RNA polymerase subunit sigma [Limnoglobus roseus]